MRVALVLLVLAAAPAFAQEPPFPEPCADGTACWLAWDPTADPNGDPVSYDILDADTGYQCAYLPWRTGPRGGRRSAEPRAWPIAFAEHLDGSCFPREAVANHYVVYAVDPRGARSAAPSNVATFVGQSVACLRGRPDCERPCWPGAPRRIPRLPECSP